MDETHWPGVELLKAQMNADLLTGDLKKKRASNESFWLIGQPDVMVERIEESDDPSNSVFLSADSTTTTPRRTTWNREGRIRSPYG